MYSLVPNTILYDNNLAPQDRLILIMIMTQCTNMKMDKVIETLIDKLAFTDSAGRSYIPSADFLEPLIKRFEDLGYIQIKNNTIVATTQEINLVIRAEATPKPTPKKESKPNPNTEIAQEVLDYLSEVRIIRGLGKNKLRGKAHLKIITDRLNEGYTKDDCIAVINHSFIFNDFFSKNTQYLVPSTLFRVSKFPTYLTLSDAYDNILDVVITETGYKDKVEEGEEWTI